MHKHEIFVDVTCPKCGGAAGNGGSGDVFSCPYCGWSGEIDGISIDMMAVDEILKRIRDGTIEEGMRNEREGMAAAGLEAGPGDQRDGKGEAEGV